MMEIPKQFVISDLVEILGYEKAIEYAVDKLGMSEQAARFVIAIELGEIESDVIAVEPGHETEE